MLTYSSSFNGVISIPPLLKIASAKIAEFLWSTATFVPENPKGALVFQCFDNAITKHREKILRISSAFTEENNLPSIFKSVFTESVYSLCRASMQVFEWKQIYDPFHEIDTLENILFKARHYFTVDAEFDDLAWSKRVVIDPFYDINFRFYLACYYCFEDETSKLWSEIRKNFLPRNGSLNYIRNRTRLLVAIRIFQLENQLETLAQDHHFADISLYEKGLVEAVRNGYVNAIRYFWKKIGEPVQMIEEVGLYFFCGNCEKTVVLLFSLFSKERKHNLLVWSYELLRGCYYWLVILLLSPYTESERSEIFEMVYKLPSELYEWLLTAVAEGKDKNRLPFHRQEVLKRLWAHLSTDKQDLFLRHNPSIVRTLMKENLFCFAEFLINSLSLEQKERYASLI